MNNVTTEKSSPCDFRCGYESTGQDLWEHVIWEHARDCPECGARKAPEPFCSLTHRPDCPRLQPGYVYPDITKAGT